MLKYESFVDVYERECFGGECLAGGRAAAMYMKNGNDLLLIRIRSSHVDINQGTYQSYM